MKEEAYWETRRNFESRNFHKDKEDEGTSNQPGNTTKGTGSVVESSQSVGSRFSVLKEGKVEECRQDP